MEDACLIRYFRFNGLFDSEQLQNNYIYEVIKMKDDNCIFCKLANGDIPTNSIYEDDDFKVILDASPATKGHALILPKQHYANILRLRMRHLPRQQSLQRRL